MWMCSHLSIMVFRVIVVSIQELVDQLYYFYKHACIIQLKVGIGLGDTPHKLSLYIRVQAH